jgi:hypothetical protein
MTPNYRREIELILVGVALAKSERDKVMVLAPGSFSKDTEELIDAIRTQKPGPFIKFMSERGIAPEKGMDFIELMVSKIADYNKRERLNMIATQLHNCRVAMGTDEMVEFFKSTLKQVEGM